jgi:hypothetical protein
MQWEGWRGWTPFASQLARRPASEPRKNDDDAGDDETLVAGAGHAGLDGWRRAALLIVVVALSVASSATLVLRPPLQSLGRGEPGARIDHLAGCVSEWAKDSGPIRGQSDSSRSAPSTSRCRAGTPNRGYNATSVDAPEDARAKRVAISA